MNDSLAIRIRKTRERTDALKTKIALARLRYLLGRYGLKVIAVLIFIYETDRMMGIIKSNSLFDFIALGNPVMRVALFLAAVGVLWAWSSEFKPPLEVDLLG